MFGKKDSIPPERTSSRSKQNFFLYIFITFFVWGGGGVLERGLPVLIRNRSSNPRNPLNLNPNTADNSTLVNKVYKYLTYIWGDGELVVFLLERFGLQMVPPDLHIVPQERLAVREDPVEHLGTDRRVFIFSESILCTAYGVLYICKEAQKMS